MKYSGKFKSYGMGPDTKNPGDHRATITLELQLPPSAIQEWGDACLDLRGQDVFFEITKVQSTIFDKEG